MGGVTLVKGGCVLSLDGRVGNFATADVLVDDGLIAEVGPGLRSRDADVVDATDCIVMPGFVDAHRHLWQSLFRNSGDGADGPSPSARYGPHHTPDDVYAATLVGLLGAAEAGITTVADWSDIQLGAGFVEAAAQAHADSGLRTVLIPEVPAWADSAPPVSASGVASGGLTTLAHGVARPAGDAATDRWRTARAEGRRIHAHAGGAGQGGSSVAELGAAGLLGPDVTLVHAADLDAADLDAVAATRTSMVLAPASEMAAGAGAPPLQRLIDRGVRPGLGVGTEVAAPGDLFAQMRTVISLQHATYFDLKLAGKAGLPNLLTTREVIRYGTIDGARAVGLGDLTGSLTPGKQADLIVLRADRPNIWPINDPIGAVVWGMDTSNVDWVIVAGTVVVRHGALEADVTGARRLAVAARERVAGAAGSLAGAGAAGGGGG